MDEQREPERIEIELTSHEPTRLILAAAFISMIALLAGVLLGRAWSDSEAADGAATATTVRVRTTTTMSSNSATLPTVSVVVSPPTTRPESTVVPVAVPEPVEAVPPVRSVIEVAPDFTDLGVEVVGLTFDNAVVRIDPATGSTVTYPSASGFDAGAVFAGSDWIVVPGFSVGNSTGALVLFDDGTRSMVDTDQWWPTGFSQVESRRFWVFDETIGSRRVIEVSLTGEPTGSELDLGFYPRLTDPLGGFVVDAPGGSYRITSEGATQLSSGRVLVAGRGTLFVEECDEVLVCEHLVVDRDTGDRRSVDVPPDVREDMSDDILGQSLASDRFNEAEDRLLLGFWSLAEQRTRFGLLDLDTGTFTEFDDVGGDTMRWVPDGRSIVWLDETGRLAVIDVATGESRRFSEDLDPLTAFALRPPSSSVEG